MAALIDDLFFYLQPLCEDRVSEGGPRTRRSHEVEGAIRTTALLESSRQTPPSIHTIACVDEAKACSVIAEATGQPVARIVRVTPEDLPADVAVWRREPSLGRSRKSDEAAWKLSRNEVLASGRFPRVSELVTEALRDAARSGINRFFYRRGVEWRESLRGSFDLVPGTVAMQVINSVWVEDYEMAAKLQALVSLLYDAPFLARNPMKTEEVFLLNEVPL